MVDLVSASSDSEGPTRWKKRQRCIPMILVVPVPRYLSAAPSQYFLVSVIVQTDKVANFWVLGNEE